MNSEKIVRKMLREDGTFWVLTAKGEFTEEFLSLSGKKRKAREIELNRMPAYTLRVRTYDDIAQYHHELIAYAIGILDNTQMYCGHAKEFIRTFWNQMGSPDINSYEEYKENNMEFMREKFELMYSLMNNANNGGSADTFSFRDTSHDLIKRYTDNCSWNTFYSNLCHLYREFKSGYGKYTFYDVCQLKDDGDKELCIFFNHPLNSTEEEIIIKRIKEFFTTNVYAVISSYANLASRGYKPRKIGSLKELKLYEGDSTVLKDYLN